MAYCREKVSLPKEDKHQSHKVRPAPRHLGGNYRVGAGNVQWGRGAARQVVAQKRSCEACLSQIEWVLARGISVMCPIMK
ncbi:hypothetical protein SKAU_G00106340 [Synaphobranchus kaupii]|uniref:Uncharacterized protein n=1 Tax=Synaphobranchus kaupii TaxID=118154 RepID=A0A9Q1J7X5_SYNKA|nr:hypothetical protein SKAU_G00106340 [Synaphobranchus kaupii]